MKILILLYAYVRIKTTTLEVNEMKLLIASDIHGDFESMKRVIEMFKEEKCDKLILLGDILYHGPRNDLPCGYAPKNVIDLLNREKEIILAARGNCDTEVDQMVLDFPILADYAYLALDGLRIFATHGHKFNTATPPSLSKGDILLHGHSHIPVFEDFGDGNVYINPGSTSIPKGGFPKSCMIYESRCFRTVDLDGNIIMSRSF